MENERTIYDTQDNIEQLRGSFDEAIVVLQGGIGEGFNGTPRITKLPRIRQLAAVSTYYESLWQGGSPVIILSGGIEVGTKYGDYSEALLMKENLVNHYGVDESRVIVEDQSTDTSTNAVYCSEILEKLGFLENGNVKLITNKFHLDRSEMLFDRYYGKAFQAISAEDILINRGDGTRLPGDKFNRRYATYARRFLETKENKNLTKKDELLKLIYSTAIGTLMFKTLTEVIRKKKTF